MTRVNVCQNCNDNRAEKGSPICTRCRKQMYENGFGRPSQNR